MVRLTAHHPDDLLLTLLADALHRVPEPFTSAPSYAVLLTLLSPSELQFFYMLDTERQKIEEFYLAREKELQDRTSQLRGQLNELIDHRKLIEVSVIQPSRTCLSESCIDRQSTVMHAFSSTAKHPGAILVLQANGAARRRAFVRHTGRPEGGCGSREGSSEAVWA